VGKVLQTHSAATVKLIQVMLGSGGGGGTPGQDFQFKILDTKMVVGNYVDGSYLKGRRWNEATGTTGTPLVDDFFILKPYLLRPLGTRTTRNVPVSYQYDADFTTRVATATGYGTETQRLVPNYEVGDVLDCIELEHPISVNVTPSGVPTYVTVRYADITEGRAWARQY
jgi:hypothetical protein